MRLLCEPDHVRSFEEPIPADLCRRQATAHAEGPDPRWVQANQSRRLWDGQQIVRASNLRCRPPGSSPKKRGPKNRDNVGNGDNQPEHKNDGHEDADDRDAAHYLANTTQVVRRSVKSVPGTQSPKRDASTAQGVLSYPLAACRQFHSPSGIAT